MMKYLCLDIGNVICNVSFDNFKSNISKTLNIDLDAAQYFLNRTQRLHDMGLTNIADELRDHFNIKSNPIVEELMQDWNKTVWMDDFMLRFIQSILNSGSVKIALLSNIGVEHMALVKKLMTDDVYNQCIRFFSCEVGARKPSFLYYKTFLDLYPEFRGSSYIDDRQENVDAGLLFGFKAYKFELDSFKSELEKAKAITSLEKLIMV